jgi:hypothetical protein
MAHRLARWFGAAALPLVAVVLAHELVFIARYGSRYGEALVHAGHGETWTAAVAWSLAVAGALTLVATLRLAHLGLLVRRRGSTAHARGALEPRPLLRAWLRIAPRTAVLGVVLLSIQENVERAAIGQAMPGPGLLLSPEYPGGLWITIVVGLAVGLVAALFDWRRSILLARLRGAGTAHVRRSTTSTPRTGVLVRLPARSVLGRRSALRGPPLPSIV